MSKPIYWVGGSKGGVGKSMVSMALVDYLIRRGETPLLVECDTSNPDVVKAYHVEIQANSLPAVSVNLDEDEGWETLADTFAAHVDRPIVVNTAARNNDSVAKRGWYMTRGAKRLERPVITLWVVNRQRDSLELLRQYQEAIRQWSGETQVHVLRNLYFGDEAKFELYNRSKIREQVEQLGGRSLNFPELSDRVADELYSNRLSLSRAPEKLSFSGKLGFEQWQSQADKVLAGIHG